jgi:hypothetical protein
MLSTVLLGAAGVRRPRLALVALLTSIDYRLPSRLHATGHSSRPLHRPRWHRAHLPRRRTTVAFLQQEPRGLATTAQLRSTIQHRRGRAEGGLARYDLRCQGSQETLVPVRCYGPSQHVIVCMLVMGI